MKKYLLFILLIPILTLKSQSLSYVDQAVLFSSDDNYGTARFTAMGGAFGSLGGDMTAVDVNPAGLAVFNSTVFSTTLSHLEVNNKSTFYGSSVNNSDDNFRLSQVGGTIIIPNYGNSDFKKFTLGFNYNLIKDYNKSYVVQGNSGIAYFNEDPNLNFDDDNSNNIYYNNVD
ncbi:MAG: hemin receptor, partial [Flavobacteriaceae bacterium]|nr:hemin receptor [Flavobacteriaceae bacterium]